MNRIVDFRKSADARSNVPYENNPSPCEYHPKMTLVDKNDTSRNSFNYNHNFIN